VFQIVIPPLRARGSDIPELARHFLLQIASRYGRSGVSIDEGAMADLCAHDWPGNVRELRNVLERAVLLQKSGVLRANDFALGSTTRAGATDPAAAQGSGPALSLDALEREHVQRALRECAGNVSKAAKLLGISRDTLRYRMERHALRR